jgi:hydrogenase/urease accessory protein HupE
VPKHAHARPSMPASRRTTRALPSRGTIVFAAVAALLALTASPAAAHGVGGDAGHRTILGFIPLGFEHMLLGWDHLLFVAGVLLISKDWLRAAKLISVFVAGHSTTLIIATLAGWRVNADLVDIIIGVSVIFVGLVGMFFPTVKWGPFAAIVFVFGLVHGLGLATRLQDAGLPEDGVLWRVIAFNVGIEAGQLTAVMMMVVIAMLLTSFIKDAPEASLRKLGSVVVFAGGAAATAIVTYQSFTTDKAAEDLLAGDAVAVTSSSCVGGDRETPLPAVGGHTAKAFFEPTEEAPLGDFGHSVADGYVVVLYPTELPSSDVAELKAWVESEAGAGVVAGAHPDDTADVHVLTARTQLTCGNLEMDKLEEFKTTWFDSL